MNRRRFFNLSRIGSLTLDKFTLKHKNPRTQKFTGPRVFI